MKKDVAILVRISAQDRERLHLAADKSNLDLSAWARKTLLDEVDRIEKLSPSLPTLQVAPKKAAKRSPRTK